MENVPTITGRGLGIVLGDLATSGYDAEWDCVPAAAFGAPHRRDRLFIIAYRTNTQGRGGEWPIPANMGAGATTSNTDGAQRERGSTPIGAQSEHPNIIGSGWWEVESNVGRVADGIPHWVDRLKCLGNAVVPQVAAHIAQILNERIK